MLNLRNIVKSLPLLARALAGSRSELLQIIAEVGIFGFLSIPSSLKVLLQMISDERLDKIYQLVSNSLNEEAAPAKVSFMFISVSRI